MKKCRQSLTVCRRILSFLIAMTDVSSKPLAGFKTTARVRGTVITYRLVLPFMPPMTNALYVIA
ncbi:MAG: hypothetical protein LBD53_02795 [Tannerella sp.]|nr:hypothetical protein [Tannerella sp.]